MTNILNLLAELHTAGVRVSLLDNYNPANLLEKADENQQTVRFRQTVQYYPIPEYTISSAANLNIKFALVGKAVDTLHEKKEYDAVQFKTVSIVKNGKIFKESLNICPDDIQKVRDMGYDVDNNGVIDLTKFDLEDGVDFDNAAFAKSVVEQYILFIYGACCNVSRKITYKRYYLLTSEGLSAVSRVILRRAITEKPVIFVICLNNDKLIPNDLIHCNTTRNILHKCI